MSKGINTRKYFGESMMLIVTLLWGATFVIVKESLADVSTMLFIGIRFTIAAVVLIPIVFRYRSSFNKQVVSAGFVIGLFLFLGFASQTIGLKHTTATKSGFLTGSAVVMVPILQTIMEKRKPTIGSITGVLIVFTGILFLSSGGNSILQIFVELGSNFNIGDAFTLLCALFFALYIIYLDIFTKKYEYWNLIILQIYTTAVLAYLFSMILDGTTIEPVKISFTGYLIFGIIYTSIFATLITTILQTRYQKLITPTKASIIFSFEPVFAAIFAFFLLNEKITNLGFIGAVLIITGLIISEILDSFIERKDA
ncbi:MAG: DMT family transporter [Melioribacteraceae bacterium]|nr:DMT family transporter [Melioribacteraceae bacterium]